MLISTNWIKDYVDLKDVDLKNLANEISLAGINVPIIKKQVDATNLVVGHVLDRKDHPDSDHLNICKIDVGTEILDIVCGAYNIDKGQKVIVALNGAVLPGNFEIRKSKIRGVESNGMVCALSELGLPDVIKDGIHVLDNDAPIGVDALEYMNLNDIIFETDVKGDRKIDSTNYLGFAYEVATILDKEIKLPETDFKEDSSDINDLYKLKIETEKVSTYLAKLVKNVEIKESPEFIKNRLIASGMRPINNVVDISNYVMLEYGQPLHFFDADKLGKEIIVRETKEDEKTITLDNIERSLKSGSIVITSNDEIVAVAGVMGSKNSEVDENTRNIIIESAIFDPISIRKTSMELNLGSEASVRFERGLGYEYTLEALKRACYLLEKYANATINGGMLIYEDIDKTPIEVKVTLQKINTVLGINLTLEDVKKYLDRLKFDYTERNETFTVIAPNRRRDINIPEDVIEEVGRLYGFHNLKPIKPTGYIKMGTYKPKTLFRKDISKYMRRMGLDEARTYTLVNKKSCEVFNPYNKNIIELPNPISKERTHLRVSLIDSLLEVYNYNKNRNVEDINIYEISNIYYKENDEYIESLSLCTLISGNYLNNKWNNSTIKSDFYTLKGILENLLTYLGFNKRYQIIKDTKSFLHPGISASILIDKEEVGYIGKIHPSIFNEDVYVLELNLEKLFNKKTSKIKYTEVGKYPSVNRDMAFWFKNDILVGDVISEINRNGSKILTNIEVFDVFNKDNKKSVAFSLTFQDKEKTLTDEEITNAFNKIIDKVCSKFNAELRNK